MNIEELCTEQQLAFIDRYKAGKRGTMKEMESIPHKFWEDDGTGLNMEFIDEKIEEDRKIKYMK